MLCKAINYSNTKFLYQNVDKYKKYAFLVNQIDLLSAQQSERLVFKDNRSRKIVIRIDQQLFSLNIDHDYKHFYRKLIKIILKIPFKS